MLRFFGATNVKVLNGGLKKWLAEERDIVGGPLKAEIKESADGNYDYQPVDQSKVILDIKLMHEAAAKLHKAGSPDGADFQVVDARTR